MDRQSHGCHEEHQQHPHDGGYGDDMDLSRVLFYQPDIFGLLPHDGPADHAAFDYEVEVEDGWQPWDQAAAAAAASCLDSGQAGDVANSCGDGAVQDGYDGYAIAYCFDSAPEYGAARPTADETAATAAAAAAAGNISKESAADSKNQADVTPVRPPSYRFRHDLPVPTDWDALQPLLRELYMERRLSLRDVAEIMKEQHQFSATERMYKHQFKKWNWQKYRLKEKKDRR